MSSGEDIRMESDKDDGYESLMVQPIYSNAWFQQILSCAVDAKGIPQHYRDILKLPKENRADWYDACNQEYNSLKERNVWELVDKPSDRKTVKGRWVFTVKSDGRKKARFVAKGFTQIFGLDYEDTFSPVARFETVCLLLALAALKDWDIESLDVKTAFLYGKLEEEIYMEQPEGYVQKGQESKVCRLLRAIYGLKQAPLQWNKELHKSLLKMGFKRSISDTGVYYQHIGNEIVIIVVYVDDALFMGSNSKLLKQKKNEFLKVWECRDLGEAKEYLGIRIIRDRKNRTLTLDQSAYAQKVVQRFVLDKAKSARTPLPTGYNPNKNDADPDPKLRSLYQSVIGSLLYIMLGTRPDIAFAVIKMSQFSANPSQDHLNRALYIVRYLAGTMSTAICFGGKTETGFISYSDSDWGMDLETRRSTTGYAIFLANGLVSWLSKRQKTISLSSTEAEYKAMSETGRQISWIKSLFEELGYLIPPVPMHCDNQGAIFLAQNPVVEGRSKHIELSEHYIRECVQDTEKVTLHYIRTEEQVADIFTKNLGPSIFETQRSALRLISQSSS
jgi:hypothetical protein